MKVLHQADRGFEVRFLQRLLNKAMKRDRAGGKALSVDGVFGPLTDAALRSFQGRHKPLVIDGVAGSNSWKALGLRTEKEHRLVRYGQITGASCWSAAATMIVGKQCVGPGGAALHPKGGLYNTIENHKAFADSLGWRMLNHSPGVQEMVNLVQRNPVWISAGGSNWSHAVVLSGVYSDGDASGDGTMFRIHDPWPMGIGRIYGSFADPITMFAANNVTREPASLGLVLLPH